VDVPEDSLELLLMLQLVLQLENNRAPGVCHRVAV
jgi:hypothetical protein